MLTATSAARKSKSRTRPVERSDDESIRAMTDVLKLMADKSRLKILVTLGRRGEMNVSDLCELLGQSQPAVSHHLTLLRMKGLVGYDRRGKNNFYHLDVTLLRDLLNRFFSDCGDGDKCLNLDDFSLTFKCDET